MAMHFTVGKWVRGRRLIYAHPVRVSLVTIASIYVEGFPAESKSSASEVKLSNPDIPTTC